MKMQSLFGGTEMHVLLRGAAGQLAPLDSKRKRLNLKKCGDERERFADAVLLV